MTERDKSTSAEDMKNSVKEAIGKLTGGIRVEAENPRRKRKEPPAKPPARSHD